MKNSKLNIVFVTIVIILLIVIVLLLTKRASTPTIENSKVLSSISTNDLNKAIEDKLPEWKSYWQKIIPGFDISNFKRIRESTIVAEEYPYDLSKNKLRESIYIYSPDKTKILDPKGGVELYEENGKVLEAYDVDSSVKLIDLKTNKWKQVAMCGTPCGFSGAMWIDNNTFVVVGMSEYYPENGEIRCTIDTKCTDVATLNVFDISKNSSTLYYGPEVDQKITRSESESSINEEVSLTYTYKNHGFTIELPKGYTPHEEQAEGGPAIMITLPNNSGINYLTDMNWWNKVDYFGDKKYLKDEKIGETLFKVYKEKDSNVLTYSYLKGNIGYVFYGDKSLLETFKFIGWAQ
ncbi:MAG: hypothetical protein WCW54_04015 [Candidatus Paceibacterota bacterium]